MEHWQRAEKSRAELGHKGDHDGLAFNFVNHAAIFYASDSWNMWSGVDHDLQLIFYMDRWYFRQTA